MKDNLRVITDLSTISVSILEFGTSSIKVEEKEGFNF